MYVIQDPLLSFTVLIFLILLTPFLARRTKIPDIVLLLLFGAVLGPHGFGTLERGDTVTLYGDLGKLYIMFLAGLEIDYFQLRKKAHRSVFFGLMTFLFPQVIGTIVILQFFDFGLSASILIASMFASHTLLAYSTATRLGIARSEPVVITVGATVITDTLALAVLAIVADTTRGAALTPLYWLTLLGGWALLIGGILLVVPFVTRKMFRFVSEEGIAQFLYVFAVTCGFAWLSRVVRMESIIGAFFCGIAFSRLIPERSALMNKIVFVGNALFIPFFLLSSGMLVNPRVLIGDPHSLAVGIVMTTTVIVTKYLSAFVVGRRFGYPKPAIPLMFGLAVPQAAATLAAAVVGYELGIFSDAVINGTMMMVLVTCPFGSWVVSHFGQVYARTLAFEGIKTSHEQRILVPVTHKESAARLLDLAFLYRNKSTAYAVYPLSIVSDDSTFEEDVARAESLLAFCTNHGAALEEQVYPEMRLAFNPGDGITRTAREVRAHLVITGWANGQKMSARIFGTLSGTLVDNCTSRLLFARLLHPLPTAKRLILLFPPLSEKRVDIELILAEVKNLTQQIGVDIVLFTTAPVSDPFYDEVTKVLSTTVKTEIRSHRSWALVKKELAIITTVDDIILVAQERRGGRFWSPTVEHYSIHLAELFPNNTLLMLYPPLVVAQEEDALEYDEETPSLSSFLEPLTLSSVDFDALMQSIKERCHINEERSNELHGLLLSCANKYPVELLPDVVLIHAHTDAVRSSRTFIVYQKIPQMFEPLTLAPRVLLIVLNPAQGEPQVHLATLSRLARIFMNPEVVDIIKDAADSSSLALALSATMTKKEA